MRLIVCLDDRFTMAFHGRRQSRDKALVNHICQMLEGKKLWINNYSAPLFFGMDADVCVDEDFLNNAEQDDFCFVENLNPAPYKNCCTEIIIYRWNRRYPGDLCFPAEMLSGMKMIYSEEFTGNSHERITQEVYRL